MGKMEEIPNVKRQRQSFVIPLVWLPTFTHFFFNYEQPTKGELKGIHICGCRCNERLKARTDGSMFLGFTGLCGELEHLKMETSLTGESFECVMGECVI